MEFLRFLRKMQDNEGIPALNAGETAGEGAAFYAAQC